MTNINVENERLKRRYFSYLSDAKGKDVKTVDKVAAALVAFERSTKCRPFKSFHIEQARAFKRYLAAQTNQRTGKPLGKGTTNSTLTHVRAFFIWLADQPGFRSKVCYSDAEYFKPTNEDRQKARAQNIAKGPTVEQVQRVLECMPHETAIEKRDRALVAFTLLTGSRNSATASLRLKHIDIAQGLVFFDAREVRTKNSKTFTTWLFPVGDDVRQIFLEWVDYLQYVEFFGPDDPLFPATLVAQGASRSFKVIGLDRKPWKSASSIQKVFKSAFAAARLPYCHPHSFRNTLARLGYEVCGGDFKALKVWSQNLAHEEMLTTYLGYGTVAPLEHGEIMQGLWSKSPVKPDTDQSELITLLKQNLEAQKPPANTSDLHPAEPTTAEPICESDASDLD